MIITIDFFHKSLPAFIDWYIWSSFKCQSLINKNQPKSTRKSQYIHPYFSTRGCTSSFSHDIDICLPPSERKRRRFSLRKSIEPIHHFSNEVLNDIDFLYVHIHPLSFFLMMMITGHVDLEITYVWWVIDLILLGIEWSERNEIVVSQMKLWGQSEGITTPVIFRFS